MEDVAGLVVLLTDPEITKTFMVPAFETPEQAVTLAEKLVGFSREEDAEHLAYGIFSDGRMIGFVNDCGTGTERITMPL